MHIHRSASGFEVLAPAKLNLFLEVLAKRNDGFHEIETLMVPVGWYDTLHFATDPGGEFTLNCQQMGLASEPIPTGEDNLVIRAVKLLRQRSGTRQGARLRLVKRIPAASGLAGGSSDAAAALVAANLGWQLNWLREELAPLAAELGSDVPFFLGRGPAVCRGRGEIMEPVAGLGPLWFVVVRPPVGLSTPAVYKACRPALEPRRAESLVTCLQQGDLGAAAKHFHNALQLAAEPLCEWIDRLKHAFAAFDCLAHQMSGSGSAYFGLCRHARHARRIAASLRTRGVGQVCAVGAGI